MSHPQLAHGVRPVAGLSHADLGLFVVAERACRDRPANGGLRVLPYDSDAKALADGARLARGMQLKHRLYGTGFSGGKMVARVLSPRLNREGLLDACGRLLEALNGTMYTGCDLNTTEHDMLALAQRTPYVLAALHSPTDASAATAHGVVAAFETCLPRVSGGPVQRVLVHGIGAVGAVVAQELVAAGYQVLTVDMDPQRQIPGTEAVDPGVWHRLPTDALVLCSASGLITDALAPQLDTRLIVAATNSPFASATAEAELATRALVLPDVLANAGAVIVDSVEHYARDAFAAAEPQALYGFVKAAVRERCEAWFEARATGLAADAAVAELLCDVASTEPLGLGFAAGTEPALREAS